MVAKPVTPFRLPVQPLPVTRQIEASFMLWLASWRQGFGYSLVYGLAGLLPLLTLDDLIARMLRALIALAMEPYRHWLPLPAMSQDAGWLPALLAWITRPQTWALLLAAMLIALAAVSALIHRQAGVGRGAATSLREDLARVPATTGAWIVYGLLLAALTLPLLALSAAFMLWVRVETVAALLLWLAGYFLVALVSVVPLTWAAVAAGFSPFTAAIDGLGPIAAQGHSVRRVRGRWVPAAVVVSVPMLVYLGAGSTVSSLMLAIAAGIAYATGGVAGLIHGDWLIWAQWLGLLPMAAMLPLALAGGVVAWNDLALRALRAPD
jgi:hypothetical protein